MDASAPQRPRRIHRRGVTIALIVVGGIALIGAIVGAATLYRLGADNPDFFADKVADIEKRYEAGYPQGGIVLTGSSFFEYWTTSQEDLAPLDTVNVGIGGTKIGDQAAYVDRLVVPFHPRAVVVYAGSNDISGLPFYSKSGDDVATRVTAYLEHLHDELPEARLYYVAITEAPVREGVRDQITLANRHLSEYADSTDYVTFIDTAPSLLTPSGDIDRALFRSDDLHFNELGYEKFAAAIRPVLIDDLG